MRCKVFLALGIALAALSVAKAEPEPDHAETAAVPEQEGQEADHQHAEMLGLNEEEPYLDGKEEDPPIPEGFKEGDMPSHPKIGTSEEDYQSHVMKLVDERWKMWDGDEDGKLDRDEIEMILKNVQEHNVFQENERAKHDAEEVFKHLDPSFNKTLSLSDLIDIRAEFQELHQKDEERELSDREKYVLRFWVFETADTDEFIERLFKVSDANHDAKLNETELPTLMNPHGGPAHATFLKVQTEHDFGRTDKNNDGKITVEEMNEAWRAGGHPQDEATHKQELTEFFKRVDLDSDGTITIPEMHKQLHPDGSDEDPVVAELAHIMQHDDDQDGKISKEELKEDLFEGAYEHSMIEIRTLQDVMVVSQHDEL